MESIFVKKKQMNTDYSVIELKIIQFIKKYYLSKLIKGILFFSLIFIILSFLIVIIEHFLFLSSFKKYIIVFTYFIFLFFVSLIYIILPFLGFIGLKINISQQLINNIIVSHFPEIKDSLWNLIELKNYNSNHSYSEELVLASID